MPAMTNRKQPLIRYAAVEASAIIESYCDWIEQETGRRPDAWSVYVGSQLRGAFQKSEQNQKRIAQAAEAGDAAAKMKAAVKATTTLKPTAKPSRKAPSRSVAKANAK